MNHFHNQLNISCLPKTHEETHLWLTDRIILDEEISCFVLNTKTGYDFVEWISFPTIYSTPPLAQQIYFVLRPFKPGNYILHLSSPLPKSLKLWYIKGVV